MVLTNVSVLTYYLRNGRGGGAGSTGCVQLMLVALNRCLGVQQWGIFSSMDCDSKILQRYSFQL